MKKPAQRRTGTSAKLEIKVDAKQVKAWLETTPPKLSLDHDAAKMGPLAVLRLRAEVLLQWSFQRSLALTTFEIEELDRIAVAPRAGDAGFLDTVDTQVFGRALPAQYNRFNLHSGRSMGWIHARRARLFSNRKRKPQRRGEAA